MIDRQMSAEFVNRVVNDPSVYPWVCGPAEGIPLDLTDYIKDGRYIALMGEHGGFLFWLIQDGIYDAHSAVLPDGRGLWAVLAAQHALRMMFNDYDANEIMMACPKGNVAVKALVRCLKAKPRGKIENGWWLNGKPVASDIYSMTKEDWLEICL